MTNALLHLCWVAAVFAGGVFGLGAACAPRNGGDPLLRFGAGVMLAVSAWFLGGWIGFMAGMSNRATAATLGIAAVGAVIRRRHEVVRHLRDPEISAFLGRWAVFALWAVGLLALIVTYSGGGWAVDWLEHWQRTQFFLDRQPLSTVFGAGYAFTARPPLVNVGVALALEATSRTFADYQVFMTLFGSLILLPITLLAQRWTRRAAVSWWVLLVLMVTPLVAQNLTFAWTKLPTAFFVLTALVLCLVDLPHATSRLTYAAWSLAMGILAHYSAAPWLIAMAAGLGFATRAWWMVNPGWRKAVLPGLAIVAPLALWLGWSALHFGSRGTLATTSTATAWNEQSPLQHVIVPARNVFDTVVPFPLRGEPDDGLIAQASRLGRLRDVAFNTYQVNLPLAFGFGGLAVLLLSAVKRTRPAAAPPGPGQAERAFFRVTIPLAVVLGIVVAPRDEWGLVHICLQPLVLLGIAWIAARLADGPPALRATWGVLAVLDFSLGTALHLALESWAIAPVVAPQGSPLDYLHQLSPVALANARDKWHLHLNFLSDTLPAPFLVTATGVLGCVAYGVVRLRRSHLGRT